MSLAGNAGFVAGQILGQDGEILATVAPLKAFAFADERFVFQSRERPTFAGPRAKAC
ncbi:MULTISPECIES: hypothetical protein [Paraburkholderia]|uniref:hypothetical protein n=1 Tax=Paraburkholderia TaxID=1822464 RepID=UPI0013A6D654|nr:MULTISPECIES: hypothetical protein [Paraburkholderia]MDH6153735.1 hypothetical protein [Paraburkholderia sp. WSM4179]